MDVRVTSRRSVVFHAHLGFYRFVTLFWPKKVKAAKLEEIHAKMVQKDPNAVKRGRPSAGAKTNGPGSSQSAHPASSARMNGKPNR